MKYITLLSFIFCYFIGYGQTVKSDTVLLKRHSTYYDGCNWHFSDGMQTLLQCHDYPLTTTGVIIHNDTLTGSVYPFPHDSLYQILSIDSSGLIIHPKSNRGSDTTRALLMLVDTSNINYWMIKNGDQVVREQYNQLESYIICASGYVVREWFEVYQVGVAEYEKPKKIRMHHPPKDYLGVNGDVSVSSSSMVVVTYKILE